MGIKHLNSDAHVDEILEILEEDAGVIIDDVLAKDQLNNITQDIHPFLGNTREGKKSLQASKLSEWEP